MANELMWRITTKCDKACPYCFNEIYGHSSCKVNNEFVDYNKVTEIIKRFDIGKVYISGGEPATHPDLLSIIAFLAQQCEVVVFTNGSLLLRYDSEILASLPLKAINVSVDLSCIVNETAYLSSLLSIVQSIKACNKRLSISAQLLLDDRFPSVIESVGFDRLRSCFDRVFWQPLACPANNSFFKHTLEGMDSALAESILQTVESCCDGEWKIHCKHVREFLAGSPDNNCLMGSVYITLNPDMTISTCPHWDQPGVPFDNYVEPSGSIVCSNISMRCVNLYSHLRRRFSDCIG